MSGGSGSMLHNPAQTKNYKGHSSFQKKNRDKLNPRKESHHRVSHHSVSDKSSEYAPLKFKLKINASKGKVEVINTITSEHLSSIKSSLLPKPVKPKKIEKEYLNARISQDVALANEPVHGGIADSVKTKKRRCKDQGSSDYFPTSSFSWDPPLMLSPKKRKPRKIIESDAPPKKWKSDASLYQRSHVQSDRKSLGTSIKLYKEQDKKNLRASRELFNERYKKKKSSRHSYDRQDNRKNVWSSKELYNEQDKRKGFGTEKELYNKQNNAKSLGIPRDRNNRIETKTSIISYPNVTIKKESLDKTPSLNVTTSSTIPNPVLILKRETFNSMPVFDVKTYSVIHKPTLIPEKEPMEAKPIFHVTTPSIICNPTLVKREPLHKTPILDVSTSIIHNPSIIKREPLYKTPILDVTMPIISNHTIIKREALSAPSSVIPIPALIPKREAVDLTPPYDLIFEIEKELFGTCNNIGLEKVKSTVTDPIFKSVARKFQESSELVLNEYLAEGYPEVEEMEKVSFEPILAEKIQHSQESSNHFASPGNVFLSCTSSQELVIASYEDAVEVETSSHCLESPPYGSQDSGYTSMTSPLSDDPEFPNVADSKPVDQADRPLCLTDVQFLKMCHNYCGGSKKWSTKKLVNNHFSKTPQKFSKVPTTKKNDQLSMIKIMSNKSFPREEPRKEFSPHGNEHAKALRDRRVVYLGNIPSSYTVNYLKEKFKRFGEIENVQIKSKENDELDIPDNQLLLLASQPLKGNSRNSVKINAAKGKTMKHFGFVTFKKIAVAREVFDRRRELCTWPGGSINYGGRREFVREDYADFDAEESNNVKPGCSYKHNQENEVDYTQLLKKEQEKRGLVISPNAKRPQHSVSSLSDARA